MNEKNIKIVAVVVALVLIAVVVTVLMNSGDSDDAENTNNNTSTGETTGNGDADVAQQETTITITEDGYSPLNIVVAEGTTVTFMNESGPARWPASDIHPTHEIYPEFDPKEEIPAGGSWSFTFDKMGEWGYHDHLTPSITGTITVVDPSTLPQPEPPTNETQIPTEPYSEIGK